jgi:hypothetical protein
VLPVRRLITCVLTVLVLCLPAADASWAAAPPGTPTATTFAGTPTVGPLFPNGLTHRHSCTASVVASPGHNLLITAAHCLNGDPSGWLFAPGYDSGSTPYRVWTVLSAYLPPQWLSGQDPHYDYAFLRVRRQWRRGSLLGVQDFTGANSLGLAPGSGWKVTDVAYNSGRNDDPVHCTTQVYYARGYPAFDCHGYVGGSSGSPWLNHGYVDGVIGGLHQGGCFEYTSYSSPFTSQIDDLWWRATQSGPGDVAPAPGSDGC